MHEWVESDRIQAEITIDQQMTTMRRRIKDLEVENQFKEKQMDYLLAENFELRQQQTTNERRPPSDLSQQDLFKGHLQNLNAEVDNLQVLLEDLRDRFKPS